MISRNGSRWVERLTLIALVGAAVIGCAVKESPAPLQPTPKAGAPTAKFRQSSETPKPPPKTVYRVGDTVDLQDIAVQDLEGQDVDWDRYQGKILLLSYFATW